MMKKVILSIAILTAASLTSFAANDNKNNQGSKPNTECSKNCCDCNKGKHGKKAKPGFGMRAFEGIDLTEAQKTQLEALRSEFKAKKDAEMKQKGEMKEKNQNLTAEQKQQLRAQKMAKRQQAQQEFNDKVKNILTPDQYTKYLDNTKKMADNKGKGMRKAHKHSKGHKHARVVSNSHKTAKAHSSSKRAKSIKSTKSNPSNA